MGIISKNNDRDEGILYSFILFVVPDGEHSTRAHENLKQLCEKLLPGKYEIKIVDVVEDFQTAIDYNILLTPSVVVERPKPQVTFHGDLSNSRKFVKALNLEDKDVE